MKIVGAFSVPLGGLRVPGSPSVGRANLIGSYIEVEQVSLTPKYGMEGYIKLDD